MPTPSLTNPTNQPGMGLGDLLSLAVPAIFGAATGGGIGGAGAGVGAMAGLGEAVGQRQELAKNEADTKYKQALEQEAEQQAQSLEMKRGELEKQIKNRDKIIEDNPNMDASERQILLQDPEKWVTMNMQKAARPGLIKQIQMRSPGTQIDADSLSTLPYDDLHDIFAASLKGAQWIPQQLTMPDGTKANILAGTNGQVKVLPSSATGANLAHTSGTKMVGGVQHKTETFFNPKTGEPVRTEDVGPEKLLANERQALEAERVGLQQSERLLDNLDQIDEKDVAKMATEGWKYNNSTIAGLAGQLTGGKIGGFDPKYVEIFTNMGQLEASLQRALTNGRVAKELYMRLIQHVPHVGEPPEITYDKLHSLVSDKGLMKQMRDAISSSGDAVDSALQGGAPSKKSEGPESYNSVEAFKKAHPNMDLEPVGP